MYVPERHHSGLKDKVSFYGTWEIVKHDMYQYPSFLNILYFHLNHESCKNNLMAADGDAHKAVREKPNFINYLPLCFCQPAFT